MTQLKTIRTRTGTALAALGVASLVAACGSSAQATHSSTASAGANRPAVSGTPASDRTLEISTASGRAGRYLTGTGGRALYLWAADRHDKSVCAGECAQAWPPLLARTKPTAGSGVKASELGTIAGHGSERQVTYDGHPLYYFAGDSGRGMTKGQGSSAFGAKWWLVSPSGSAITSGGSSAATGGSGSGSSGTPATTTSSSSSAGGGWG
jgi:predicted lipoprotein with Yx(FWY)xxD motif